MRKTSGPNNFTGKFFQVSKEKKKNSTNHIPTLPQAEKEKCFPTYFIRLVQQCNQTMIITKKSNIAGQFLV